MVLKVSCLLLDAMQKEMRSSRFKTSCDDVADARFTEQFEFKLGAMSLSWKSFAVFAKVNFKNDYCQELAEFFVQIPGTEDWLPACLAGNIRSLCCVSCKTFQQKKYPDYCDAAATVVVAKLASPAKRSDAKLEVCALKTVSRVS